MMDAFRRRQSRNLRIEVVQQMVALFRRKQRELLHGSLRMSADRLEQVVEMRQHALRGCLIEQVSAVVQRRSNSRGVFDYAESQVKLGRPVFATNWTERQPRHLECALWTVL